MLAKLNRIRKQKDFEAIFKNSKSFKNNLFIFKIMKNGLGSDRFGFVISQKVSKKAVVRNRIKRRLAEIIRAEIKNMSLEAQAKGGIDLVLIALPSSGKATFFETKESVESALIKLKLVAEIKK